MHVILGCMATCEYQAKERKVIFRIEVESHLIEIGIPVETRFSEGLVSDSVGHHRANMVHRES
jgi:hypothetical protein